MKFFTLKGKCLCPLNMPRITFPRPLKVMLPPEVLVRSQQPKSIRCSLERPPITPQPPPFLLFSTYWIKKNREMTDCRAALWDLTRKIMRNIKNLCTYWVLVDMEAKDEMGVPAGQISCHVGWPRGQSCVEVVTRTLSSWTPIEFNKKIVKWLIYTAKSELWREKLWETTTM